MKRSMWLLAAVALLSSSAWAQHSDKERKEDAARHRAMAVAHENAAKCLESAKSDAVCAQGLQAACRGLAIGKYCGMKHAH
jgi:hypothetical protein